MFNLTFRVLKPRFECEKRKLFKDFSFKVIQINFLFVFIYLEFCLWSYLFIRAYEV